MSESLTNRTLKVVSVSTRAISSVESFNDLLQEVDPSQIFVLTDSNTVAHCLPRFEESYLGGTPYSSISVEAGEESKSIEVAEEVWQILIEANADRSSLLISLGGGMITDLGGFVASTYKRGIASLLVPTTHLSMTDAAIGGKTGVNYSELKNQIGTVHDAEGVLVDSTFLETLPHRELKSGFIETVKHGLIADVELWNELRDGDVLSLSKNAELIKRSLLIKDEMAKKDRHDHGIRQALNFGHTVGHALEADAKILHGEAVAFGTVAELFLSHKICALPHEHLVEAVDYLKQNFDVPVDKIDEASLLNKMYNDKKNRNGNIRFTLIPNIGKVKIGINVDEETILESIRFAAVQML